MKPLALVLVYITEEHRELVSEHFELIYAPNEDLGKDRTNGAAQIAARAKKRPDSGVTVMAVPKTAET